VRSIITFAENADATFIHESAHHWLEQFAISDLLISGLRVEGSDRRNSGSRQLVVQKMGFATVDR
jgi:hypothetical protein